MNFVRPTIGPDAPARPDPDLVDRDDLASQTPFEREMAALIVETLQLEVSPEDLVPCDPVFHDGLGLDSIDALEIALAISKRYGVELKSDDARNGAVLESLRNLCVYVAFHRIR